jgi:1-acyl-sn-glycerol-3-phosphate acyltransferase
MSIVKRESYPRWLIAIGRVLLKMFGWRCVGDRVEVPKCVIICAPHSTNWDFPLFLLGTIAYDMPAMFTMKQDWFFWPLGILWRWLGGVPIDRSKRTNVVDQLIATFNDNEVLRLGMQPEGTRKDVEFWKTGFYWVAQGAGVPLVMSSLDYRKKEMALAPLLYPTDDADTDLRAICAHYKKQVDINPRFRQLEEKAEDGE